jgi:thiol:disulfide interchange protein DsbD
MNKLFRILLIVLYTSLIPVSGIWAQRVEQPVRWSINTEKGEDGIFLIKLTGNFDAERPEWHIYGLGPYENGPTPTSFVVESTGALAKTSSFELVGKPYLLTQEKRKYDEMFGMEIGICEEKVIIAQKVRVLSADSVSLLAIVEWQACDDQSCLPPTDKEFLIKLPGAGKTAGGTVSNTGAASASRQTATTAAGTGSQTAGSSAVKGAAGTGSQTAGSSVVKGAAGTGSQTAGSSAVKGAAGTGLQSTGSSAGVTANGSSSGQPAAGGSGEVADVSSASSDVSGGSDTGAAGGSSAGAAGDSDSGDSAGSDAGVAGGVAGEALAAGDELAAGETTGFSPGTTGEDKSMWGVIIEAIIWGFVALLTPCVFPMVPMTVSFFLKQSQEGQARELAAVEGAAGSGVAGGAGASGSGAASGTKGVRSSSARGRIMASFFGLSIIALYTLPIAAIIVITYFAGGEAVTADIFNWLATHWVPNVLFFLIFMIFAASFFGAFEIVLPSWLVNKSDSKSDKGGYAGVFFMALTLVLVSFSCTGPIVGTILIKSTQGEIWEPIITMLAFSAAFALPFTIFAFAPSLLKDLPKSGGWLNSVKVVLGFIEVALGFKFLSVADQVYHWGLLDREVYLAIWIVVFTLMGLYLLGKLRFAHDSPTEYITVKRLAFSIITFAFVVYMIPGMWGAPLKALSGYLPPMTSQDFRTAQVGGFGAGGYGAYDASGAGAYDAGGRGVNGQYPAGANGLAGAHTANDSGTANVSGSSYSPRSASHSLRAQGVVPMYSDFLHLPHGLEGFFRYEEGMEYARKVGKPVFIDFTGHGCVNCREMEARVWSDPRVLKLLREEFVLIALYADDKKTAIESDWVTSESGRVLKSIGKINANLAMSKYNVNAQPYYAIIDPATEGHLTEPRGYNLDVNAFVGFLEKGIEANKRK